MENKKLKVGMYVRFDYHRVTVPIQIAKIKEKYYDKMEKYYYYLTDNGLIVSEENIIKASENIIDLIEVGDYVNGKKVVFIDEYDRIALDENDIKTRDVEGRYEFLTIKKEDIKSIVTKEQFESMKYIVEE